MADRNNCAANNNTSVGGRDTVCISTNRVLDSCRDKDCFEDVKVYLTDCGQDLIEKTNNIRIKCAKIIWTQITVEPVQFNRGFFQVTVRFYVKIVAECCLFPGKIQEFEGIAACEKKVILFGSEGAVSIFRSDPNGSGFCPPLNNGPQETNLPTAVCEVADPVVLDAKVVERRNNNCCCCCCLDEIPDYVGGVTNGNLTDSYEGGKTLVCTLGFFSVVRMERPAQFLINATEYSVPDKECISPETNDPCALFRKMAFPVSEFCPPSYRQLNCKD